MGFRFGKSIRLGKHVRLNVSKSGIGVSAGVKGFRIGTGPRGTRVTSSIPGTGLRYTQQLGTGSRSRQQQSSSPPSVSIPKLPSAGLFAPSHEKEFRNALENHLRGQTDQALQHFLKAAPQEPSAAIFAAIILSAKADGQAQATALLENVVQSDSEFPTALMQKYLGDAAVKIRITPSVEATVPVDGLGATLALAELYQEQDRIEDAIGLLEEIDELAGEPVLTLSLCELYASRGLWDGIVERAKQVPIEDDVTLEIAILYGRAMQEKNLHEAAISVFSSALKKKKGRFPELLREAAYWRAVSYEAVGKKSQAKKEFQKIYAEAPDFRDAAQRIEAS